MSLVSVIIPCYNHGKYLKQRIQSVLEQSYTDLEIILLDDCSTDNSLSIMNQYAQNERVAAIVQNDKNSGSPFIQWQKGLNLANGKYIWIAESDDFAHPDFLKNQISILSSTPQIGLCFSASNWVNESNEIIEVPEHEAYSWQKSGKDLIANDFTIGCPIYNASSAVFRKSLIQYVDFQQIIQFKFTGDWLFWVQLINNTTVYHLGERLNFFRRHIENVSTESNKKGLQFSEGFRVVNYIFQNHKISFLQKRKIMVKWALKVYHDKVIEAHEALKFLPQEIKIWYNLIKIYFKIRN